MEEIEIVTLRFSALISRITEAHPNIKDPVTLDMLFHRYAPELFEIAKEAVKIRGGIPEDGTLIKDDLIKIDKHNHIIPQGYVKLVFSGDHLEIRIRENLEEEGEISIVVPLLRYEAKMLEEMREKSIKIPVELYERAERMAKEFGMDMDEFIQDAVRRRFDELEAMEGEKTKE